MHELQFREWLKHMVLREDLGPPGAMAAPVKPSIISAQEAMRIDLPREAVISFDFDGTLTKWNQNQGGWYEVPFIPIIRDLKTWASKGHRCIVCTHRTQNLEGNPAFLGKGRDKMKVLDLIQDDVVPVQGNDILFTHMGDKGEILVGLAARGLRVIMHYDDEMKNLTSVVKAGIIGVRVDPGPAPPKYVVPGDEQTPAAH